MVTAFTISLAVLYDVGAWDRWRSFSTLGQSLNAVLIMFCASMPLRYALARDFKTHRRWALRLYLMVSASLFLRAGLFLSLFLNHGPFGFKPVYIQRPFPHVPIFRPILGAPCVLEIYLRTNDRGGTPARFTMAAGFLY